MVTLAIFDKISGISIKNCQKSGFWVPGFQFSGIHGLNFEKETSVYKDSNTEDPFEFVFTLFCQNFEE